MNSQSYPSPLWCDGTFELRAEGLGRSRTLTLHQPFGRLGTLPGCELTLSGPGMPKRLLYLHATPHGVFALPLVPRDRFAPVPSGWLPLAGHAGVGPYRVAWQWNPRSPAPPSEAFPADTPFPDLTRRGTLPVGRRVKILVEDRFHGEIQLSRRLTLVGRRAPCHVILTSRTISSCHCVIVGEADQIWVVDLCSGNFTLLEDVPIQVSRWAPGSKLTLGRVSLILEEASQTQHAVTHFSAPVPVAILQKADKMAEVARVPPASRAREESPTFPATSDRESRVGLELPLTGPVPADFPHDHIKTAACQTSMAGPAIAHDEACTQIIVEEIMHGDRGSVWAKDLVLSLLASHNGEVGADGETRAIPPSANAAADRNRDPTALETGPDVPEACALFPQDSLWESKSRELAYKEALLHEWARSLDEMSESLLRLQEELVAEEDRFAQEKERVAREQSELALAWEKYQSAVQRLQEWEVSLKEKEKQFAAEKAEVTSKAKSLAEREAILTEEQRHLANLRQELEATLHHVQEKQAVLEQRQKILEKQFSLLWEEEQRVREAQRELETSRHDLEKAWEELRRKTSTREAIVPEGQNVSFGALNVPLAAQGNFQTTSFSFVETESLPTAAVHQEATHEESHQGSLPETAPADQLNREIREAAPAAGSEPPTQQDALRDSWIVSALVQSGGRPWVNLPLPRAHGPRTGWLLVGGISLALIVTAMVWWIYPRTYSTFHRLSFFETPLLLAIRDGQLPPGIPPEIAPKPVPSWPDDPTVVAKLRSDPTLAQCPLVRRKGLAEVLDSVRIGRTEGLPYITWHLVSSDATSSRFILEQWQKNYFAELVARAKTLGEECVSHTRQKLASLEDRERSLRQRLEAIAQQWGSAEARTLEIKARELAYSADIEEQEVAQLASEIEAHRRQLQEVQSVLSNPAGAITEAEVEAATAERFKGGGTRSEVIASPTEVPSEASQSSSGSPGDATTPSPQVAETREPKSEDAATPPPESKREVLRSIVRQELAESKRREAAVFLETLTAELTRLQERWDEARRKTDERRRQATELMRAISEVQAMATELEQVQKEISQWQSVSQMAEKLLAESVSPPEMETHQSVAQTYIPVLAALGAGCGTFLPFALLWFLQTRRIQTDIATEALANDNTKALSWPWRKWFFPRFRLWPKGEES